ncbi:MAG: hypothetical protein M3Q36_03215 [bacterium]|nr:hypothetical protein [bacterium]
MNESTNLNQAVPEPQNPQEDTVSPEAETAPLGSSNSSDFQSSPAQLLDDEASNFTVQDVNGEKINSLSSTGNDGINSAAYAWGAALLAAVVISIWIVRFILKPQRSVIESTKSKPAQSKSPLSISVKKTKTKKKAPPYARKKSAKKKR